MGLLQKLRGLVTPSVDPALAALYAACVAASRQPVFYARLGVPDMVDGRFDMLLLHVFLVIRRLSHLSVKQKLFDMMFADMDRSLREMGVGDMSIGKKIKPMLSGFYGRAEAYEKALAAPDDAALVAALARNIYGRESADGAMVLAHYVRASVALLAATDEAALVQGLFAFAACDDERKAG